MNYDVVELNYLEEFDHLAELPNRPYIVGFNKHAYILTARDFSMQRPKSYSCSLRKYSWLHKLFVSHCYSWSAVLNMNIKDSLAGLWPHTAKSVPYRLDLEQPLIKNGDFHPFVPIDIADSRPHPTAPKLGYVPMSLEVVERYLLQAARPFDDEMPAPVYYKRSASGPLN
jgi:hypothetical protein